MPAADPIKVGVNLELSGVSSTWGQPQLNSIQMYVDEANARGGIGGRRIELEVLDNKSDPAQSRLNATKLAGDGVVAILGAGTTPTTMPAVPVANESGVPMISNGAGNVITNPVDQRRWVFKTPNDDSQVANKIAGFLAKQKLTEIAFLSVNTAYGDSGKTNFAHPGRALRAQAGRRGEVRPERHRRHRAAHQDPRLARAGGRGLGPAAGGDDHRQERGPARAARRS